MYDTGPMNSFMTPGARSTDSNNYIFGNKKISRTVNVKSLTREGMRFLQGCFAAPDFAGQGNFMGIPDDLTYKVVPYRHILTNDFSSLIEAGTEANYQKDLIIIVPPTPGYAFWYTWVKPGDPVQSTTLFTGVPYSDFEQLFGKLDGSSNDYNKNINAFRMASNIFELVNLENATSFQGSINAVKFDSSYGDAAVYGGSNLAKSITGLENCNATNLSTYASNSNMGIYISCQNKEVVFMKGVVPDKMIDINGGDNNSYGVLRGVFTGYGTLETACIRLRNCWIPQITGGFRFNSFTVRCWSLVEYIPNNDCLIAQFQMDSPPYDKVAMDIYADMTKQLPVAVSSFDNDSFWKRLLNVVGKAASFIGGVLPGPWGLIGKGVGTVASTVSSMIR
jgi:hypothetical protein